MTLASKGLEMSDWNLQMEHRRSTAIRSWRDPNHLIIEPHTVCKSSNLSVTQTIDPSRLYPEIPYTPIPWGREGCCSGESVPWDQSLRQGGVVLRWVCTLRSEPEAGRGGAQVSCGSVLTEAMLQQEHPVSVYTTTSCQGPPGTGSHRLGRSVKM